MKFKIIRNFLPIEGLFKEFKKIKHEGILNDVQCPGTPSFYKPHLLDKIHIKGMKILEKEFGVQLYPTYAFARIYQPESILDIHVDRPACEFSATINLGYDGDYNWPIYIKSADDEITEAILEKGDALIYKGTECEHWRDPSNGRVTEQIQAFLHYVDQEGPYEQCIYDKIRP